MQYYRAMRYGKDEHHVSNSLQVYRKKQSMTQEELADTLGVTRQTIIAIERGKYLPSLPLALLIARRFNVTVEDIFTL